MPTPNNGENGSHSVLARPGDSFFESALFWVVLLFRLAIQLPRFSKLISGSILSFSASASTALRSVLVDPAFLASEVKEASAIRTLFDSENIADSYRGFVTKAPPLLLYFADAIQGFLSGRPIFSAAIDGCTLLLIDILISWLVQTTARVLLTRVSPREDYLLRKMPDRIRPKLSHVFGSGIDRRDSMLHAGNIPSLMALIYFCSPVVASSGVLNCWQNLPVLFLLLAIHHSVVRQSSVWTAYWLSFSAYLSIHNIIFSLPIAIILERHHKGWALFAAAFLISFAFLLYLDVLLVGRELFLPVFLWTHLHSFHIKHLSPSLSTLWYLGMELFERFWKYHTVTMAALPYLVIAPTVLRLHQYPETLIALYWWIGTLFRPPGTLYSFTVGLCLTLLSPRALARIRLVPTIIALCALWVPVTLYLVNHCLWLQSNTGEANFVFFQCLAYNVFLAIFVLQFCSAALKRDKALRVVENLGSKTD